MIRSALMGYLRFVAERGGHGARIAPVLSKALKRSGAKRILDLGSGGGGPTVPAFLALRDECRDVELALSDLRPNVEALEGLARSSPDAIRVIEEPIDASRVPATFVGVRSLMNVLHHLRPELVRAVFQDAVHAEQSIVVVEMLRRHPVILLLNLFSWAGVLLAVPWLRPFDWRWLVWTYLLPVIPLVFVWDAVVSTLRIYSERELREIVESLDGSEAYDWDFESLSLPPSPLPSLALVGTPKPDASKTQAPHIRQDRRSVT